MSVQATIEANLGTLPPSMRRVAEVVRENPAVVLEQTINELALACETSVASVVRFCRAIGLSGYSQLRMRLATELGKESAQFAGAAGFGSDIAAGDSLQEIAGKISSLEILAIEDTVSGLDYESLATVVEAMDRAERILLFGVGASQFVAEDLQHKLFRIGRNAFLLRDPHEAWSAAALPAPRTVAIAFSHLGETHETVRFLDVAKQSGSYTVAVSSVRESSLARSADAGLFTSVRETTFRAGAMVSRIAQLTLVDCIFAGVAQLRYDDTVEALRRTREVTRDARGA